MLNYEDEDIDDEDVYTNLLKSYNQAKDEKRVVEFFDESISHVLYEWDSLAEYGLGNHWFDPWNREEELLEQMISLLLLLGKSYNEGFDVSEKFKDFLRDFAHVVSYMRKYGTSYFIEYDHDTANQITKYCQDMNYGQGFLLLWLLSLDTLDSYVKNTPLDVIYNIYESYFNSNTEELEYPEEYMCFGWSQDVLLNLRETEDYVNFFNNLSLLIYKNLTEEQYFDLQLNQRLKCFDAKHNLFSSHSNFVAEIVFSSIFHNDINALANDLLDRGHKKILCNLLLNYYFGDVDTLMSLYNKVKQDFGDGIAASLKCRINVERYISKTFKNRTQYTYSEIYNAYDILENAYDCLSKFDKDVLLKLFGTANIDFNLLRDKSKNEKGFPLKAFNYYIKLKEMLAKNLDYDIEEIYKDIKIDKQQLKMYLRGLNIRDREIIANVNPDGFDL